MSIHYLIGIALMLWLVKDLFTGKAYLLRAYERSSEPEAYWFTCLLWFIVAATCFIA